MRVFLLSILFFSFPYCFADSIMASTESERLQMMLNERKLLFDRYADQVEKRSGIFGGRTKRDLTEANSILEKVILKDNAIFRELERLLDQRKFETSTLGSRMLKQDERLITHVESNEKLLASFASLKKEEADLKRQLNRLELKYFAALIFNFFFAGLLVYLYFVRRNNSNGGKRDSRTGKQI